MIDRSDVDRLLAVNRYLVLGTADEHGQPWATPVFFAPLDPDRVCWVSGPDSRHSRNVAQRPAVAITVFDSTVDVGRGEAAYFDATAHLRLRTRRTPRCAPSTIGYRRAGGSAVPTFGRRDRWSSTLPRCSIAICSYAAATPSTATNST